VGALGDSAAERTRELAREAVRRLAPEESAFFEETANAYFEDPGRVSTKARPEPLGIGIEAVVVGSLTAFALPVATSVVGSIATDFMRDERRRGWWRRRRARADDGAGGGTDGGGTGGGADNPFAAPGTVRPVALRAGEALRPADLEFLRRIAYERGSALGLPPGQARLLADAIVGGVVGGSAASAADGDGPAPGDGPGGEGGPS
jgi:hypothetical protein